MNSQQGIVAAIVAIVALTMASTIGVLATSGDGQIVVSLLGFGGSTVAALLAFLKSLQTKATVEEHLGKDAE